MIRAPMTGTVMRVNCKVGDVVEADQTLAVLTAMKMEHKLCAGLAGIVRKVVASEGANVEQGTILIEVEASKP
jgi:biotin carboxyl carrier protein